MVRYPTHVLMLANPWIRNGTTLIQQLSPTVRIHPNLSTSDESFLTGGSSEQGDTALPSDSGLTVVALSNPHGESDAKPCDSGFHRGRLRASGRVRQTEQKSGRSGCFAISLFRRAAVRVRRVPLDAQQQRPWLRPARRAEGQP